MHSPHIIILFIPLDLLWRL